MVGGFAAALADGGEIQAGPHRTGGEYARRGLRRDQDKATAPAMIQVSSDEAAQVPGSLAAP
jgi:hypothetical protein